VKDGEKSKVAHAVKRSMDIVGGLCAVCLFSPLIIPIAVAIKLTSKGPILFRQQRVGQYGRKFTFLKFRSMYAVNNHGIHEEFVKEMILGDGGAKNGSKNGSTNGSTNGSGNHKKVYKVTQDPRTTAVGRFLRRTSLDELPQILNVLAGQMSLVGPRPPIPYEVACYDVWHKRRLLVARPGLTGLWQVRGRSRVKFDDMVRLDLEYAQSWSLWLDIKILLKTPAVMLTGDGGY
jgi:lipopolysaccharide/colanic/teichoic acid biosynthesis glycosyltransferase